MNAKNIVFLIILLGLFGCRNKSETGQQRSMTQQEQQKTSIPKETPKAKTIELHYSELPYRHSDSGRAHFKDFTESQKQIVYGLNRIDAKNVRHVDTLVIPDTFLGNWLQYSPFPLVVPFLDSVHKIVIFSYPIQAFAAYENGRLVRWGPTSMGSKSHPTPTGLHFANWKSKKSVSTVKDEWILPWNFNIINKGGVGWHQYSMPGYPASHSCLRLHEADAKWLYYFAHQWILESDVKLLAQGTPVVVYGSYDFKGRKPWLRLPADPKATTIRLAQLKEVLAPYLSKIMEEQQKRDQVLKREAKQAGEDQ